MTKPTLYLMLGYPGAGKTTTAKVIHELTGAVHLWADHERRKLFRQPTHSHNENLSLYKDLNQRTNNLLADGISVIFDTNFSFFRDRQHMREIARENGAIVKLIWVTTPKGIAKERATGQEQDQTTRILGSMPASEFERMAGNLQAPRDNEPYIEVDGTKVTREYIAGLLHEPTS